MLKFVASYDLLQPSERTFVDDFIAAVEREAAKRFERLTSTLERVSQSIDASTLDERTRDLFAKPMIRAAIFERVNQLASQRDITPERVIQEIAALALANMEDYLDVGEDGLPTVDLADLSRVQMAAIQSIEVEDSFSPTKGEVRKIKFKLHDKIAPLQALMKHMGMDKENAIAAAYAALPRDLVQLPANATQEALAEDYARFIDG